MAAYRRRALAVACARRPPWDVLRPEAAICVVGLPKTYRVMTRVCGGIHHAGLHTVLPRVTVLAVMLSSRLGGAGTCALRSEAVWAPLQVSDVRNSTATMAAVIIALVHRVL